MPIDPKMQELLDRDSIRTVILRVCRAMDRADLELFRSCYHPDAWDDHGYYKGLVSEFMPQSIARPAHVKSLMHTIANIIIEVSGDEAWSESYYVAYQRATQDGADKDTSFGGRYFDRFERRNGEWKIAHRITIYDWTRVDPVEQTLTIPGAVVGSASREDPTYKRVFSRDRT